MCFRLWGHFRGFDSGLFVYGASFDCIGAANSSCPFSSRGKISPRTRKERERESERRKLSAV